MEKPVNETGKGKHKKRCHQGFFPPKFVSIGLDILWHLSLRVRAAVCVTVAFRKPFVQLLGQIVGLLSFTLRQVCFALMTDSHPLKDCCLFSSSSLE